jgi:sterol desaturase/sphingolipid hydroxylase (fatty acid hydroxylase superfamily)
MEASGFGSILRHYHWQLSLCAAVGIVAATLLASVLASLIPTLRGAQALNKEAAAQKMRRESYAANQKWNRKWGAVTHGTAFGLILPFCLTLDAQPWWKMLLDAAVILLFYDFFYYLVHRFLFHGVLIRVHAVHHRQHNPCRLDASYIHPLEVAIGVGLYATSIFVLSRFMGEFHLLTIVLTWVAFVQVNLHNHDLWQAGHFPYKYLNYMSKMHHHHHASFTGGNFATISLLYDRLFGTYDMGAGYGAQMTPRSKSEGRRPSPKAHAA